MCRPNTVSVRRSFIGRPELPMSPIPGNQGAGNELSVSFGLARRASYEMGCAVLDLDGFAAGGDEDVEEPCDLAVCLQSLPWSGSGGNRP